VSEAPPENRVRLVVVTGSGRSGTSTVAGTLKRLGLHVPQPEMPADETNPRGFYEPIWVVDFHKRLLNSIPARTNDARPQAAADVAEAASAPEVREELRTWLAEHVAEVGPGGQLVIKDPRAFWAHELWSSVADELGIEMSYLTMLSNQTDEFRRTRQTANLAGWVNSAYWTDVATRPRKRTFVRYTDLLADWRSAMAQAQRHLGIDFNADLSTTDHHDVDDFIDAKLYRSKISWDDVDTIPELREQATIAWDACNTLVDAPYDEGAIAALADVHERYTVLHQYAEAIALDHTNRAVALGRREVQEKNADLRKRLNRRRNEVQRLQGELEKSGSSGGSRLPWKR
jgi:hypothetical protein